MVHLVLCANDSSKHGRVDLHRRLGAVGVTIGILVLISGAVAAMGLAPRLLEKYGNIDADFFRIAGAVWGNFDRWGGCSCPEADIGPLNPMISP